MIFHWEHNGWYNYGDSTTHPSSFKARVCLYCACLSLPWAFVLTVHFCHYCALLSFLWIFVLTVHFCPFCICLMWCLPGVFFRLRNKTCLPKKLPQCTGWGHSFFFFFFFYIRQKMEKKKPSLCEIWRASHDVWVSNELLYLQSTTINKAQTGSVDLIFLL